MARSDSTEEIKEKFMNISKLIYELIEANNLDHADVINSMVNICINALSYSANSEEEIWNLLAPYIKHHWEENQKKIDKSKRLQK